MDLAGRARESLGMLWRRGLAASLGTLALGRELYEAATHLKGMEPMALRADSAFGRDRPQRYFNRVSDIYAHLPTLYRETVSRGLKTVLELGTRDGESTVVLLDAVRETGGSVTSVDMAPCPEAESRVHDEGLDPFWTFIQADDTAMEWKTPIDHLFIDTSHEYEHTKRELEKYEPLVRKGGIITMHDTTSYPAVWRAVQDHFRDRKDAKVFRYLHNNGLALIEKLP